MLRSDPETALTALGRGIVERPFGATRTTRCPRVPAAVCRGSALSPSTAELRFLESRLRAMNEQARPGTATTPRAASR